MLSPVTAQQLPRLFPARAPQVRAASSGERPLFRALLNRQLFDPSAGPFRPVRFVANPAPGVEVEVETTSLHRWPGSEAASWSGRTLGGSMPGSFSLTVNGAEVSGHFSMGGRLFDISGSGGSVSVQEADPGWRLRCNAPAAPAPEDAAVRPRHAASGHPVRLAATALPRIYLLVVYTQAARSQAGGSSAIETRIRDAVAYTNQALTNNGLTTQFVLTGMAELAYTETGSCDTALDHLRKSSDGQMDAVHGFRDQTGADLVQLWVSQGDCGGLAYLITGNSPSYGFGVVNASSSASWRNMTVAHELGHNLGSAHDRLNAGNTGYAAYSYGYQNTTASPFFRDIMAYECSGVSCPFVQAYSSPDYYHQGRPLGRPAGTSDAADARLTFQNTVPTLVTFRNVPTRMAAYAAGVWTADLNGNLLFDGTAHDRSVLFSTGQLSEVPVRGDWNGDGRTDMAVYVNGTWMIDANGNGVWDGGAIDRLIYFGGPGYQPFAGDWNGDGKAEVAVHKDGTWMVDYNGDFQWNGTPSDRLVYFGGPGYNVYIGTWNGVNASPAAHKDGTWLIDYNGNWNWDGAVTDRLVFFGGPGYTPVLGDWNGDNRTDLAVYLNGTWLLDYNGNLAWNGTVSDRLFYLGGSGYTPIAGDWNGNGKDKPGAFATGIWILDRNGNFLWDGSTLDALASFGSTTALPVPAKWQ